MLYGMQTSVKNFPLIRLNTCIFKELPFFVKPQVPTVLPHHDSDLIIPGFPDNQHLFLLTPSLDQLRPKSLFWYQV